MTDEQMRDLVKECGLDWQRGYAPLFDGDPTNRYAVLIEAVEAAERERWRQAAEYAAHQLEKARVWGGTEWHYNPLHPLHYLSALERLRDALRA